MSLYFLLGIVGYQISYFILSSDILFQATWLAFTWLLLLSAPIVGLTMFNKKLPWPFGDHYETYAYYVKPQIGLLLTVVLLFSMSLPGSSIIYYIPILNPLDIGQIIAIATLALYFNTIRKIDSIDQEYKQLFMIVLGAIGFFWLNNVLAKIAYQWFSVPFEVDALLYSIEFQTALSLLWTSTAIVAMIVASKWKSRPLWLTGGGLLTMVIAKLFLVELGSVETIARIISFIGVGALIILLSYISPIPPKIKENNSLPK